MLGSQPDDVLRTRRHRRQLDHGEAGGRCGENGTGLGLALVSKIISDHEGWISVDSVPGRTVFRISLPLAPRGLRALAWGTLSGIRATVGGCRPKP